MSEFKARIRKCFHQFDLFKTNANLRTKGQADTSRVCSGVFSILLIGFFMYIFITELIKVFNYDSITSKETFQTQTNFSVPSASNIKISYSPAWQAFDSWNQFFNVSMYLVSQQQANAQGIKVNPPKYTKLDTQICQQKMWQKYPQIYTGFGFESNLCIKDPSSIQLQGSNPLGKIQYFLIRTTKRNDVNQSVFLQQFKNLFSSRSNFGTFYMPDVSINTQKQNPIQQYLPFNIYLHFTYSIRKQLIIYLGSYSVQTDKNIWPLAESKQTIQGYYISKKDFYDMDKQIDIFSNPNQQIYNQVYIYMTNQRRKLDRNVGKIDNVISYAGGLFGILIAFFSYCVFNYNRYSYQLIVAQTAFSNDGHSSKIRQKNFHFFRYIKYQIFSWFKLICQCQIPWSDCKKIQQSRNQANKYMDVNSLFRRIQLFQLLLSYLVNQNKYMLIQLTQPPSISMVKQKRLMIQYYQQIIDKDVAIKYQDVKNKNQSLKLYTQKQLKNQRIKKNIDVEEPNNMGGIYGNGANIGNGGNGGNIGSDGNLGIGGIGNVNIIQKQRIIQNMKYDLKIENDQFLEQISNFPEIQKKAEKIKLNQQMKKIEIIFTKAYLDLKQNRNQIIQKIPFKIVFRLAHCAKALKNQQTNQANYGINQGNQGII